MVVVLVGVLIAYLLLAYVILPAMWSHHEHEPGLASLPMATRTSDVPGDALNVGLVGSKTSCVPCMPQAKAGTVQRFFQISGTSPTLFGRKW